MKKIPVGATIAHAYGFAFGHFLSLLRLLWLPLAALLAINFIAGPQIAAVSAGIRTHDFSAMTMPGWLVAALVLASLLFGFMIITGCFEVALNRVEAHGRFFYLPIGKPLWRLLGALVLLTVVMAVLVAIYVLAAMVVLFVFRFGLAAAHIGGPRFDAIMAFDGLLAFLAGFCAAIFCYLRFGFLLGAATIAEGKIGLFRSWTLSHHNFWRMFAVSLALFLPFMAVELAGLYAMGVWSHIPAGASAQDISALQTAASEAAMARMQQYWFVYYPAVTIVTLAMYGLLAGASSFAWRALTETEA